MVLKLVLTVFGDLPIVISLCLIFVYKGICDFVEHVQYQYCSFSKILLLITFLKKME